MWVFFWGSDHVLKELGKLSDCAEVSIAFNDLHTAGHFRDKSFCAIDCTDLVY